MSIETQAVGDFAGETLQGRIVAATAEVLGLNVTDDISISNLVEVNTDHFRCFVLCNNGSYRVHGRRVPITNLWVCVYHHRKGTATTKVGDKMVVSGWVRP